jgi:purine nucleosidase
LMGGAVHPPGNVTPTAEFNIYADPDAAAIVFQQHWPLTMVGLDVTNRVTVSRRDRDQLGVLVREVTRHLFDIRQVESIALHDPLALAVALQPDLVTCVPKDVAVETIGTHTLGQTVVDLRPGALAPVRNTRVCTDVDVERSRSWLFAMLG